MNIFVIINVVCFLKEKFNVDEGHVKQFILKNIGKKWKDNRYKLYNEWYDPTVGREANLTMHPPGISMDQWAGFLDYRARDKTKVMLLICF